MADATLFIPDAPGADHCKKRSASQRDVLASLVYVSPTAASH